MNKIEFFDNEYRFLSNFFVAYVQYDGIIYPTSEHAFQASKSLDFDERLLIAKLSSPNQAKIRGKQLKLRPNWNLIRNQIMTEICILKFATHIDLKQKLMKTGNAELIESNSWGDSYWGICNKTNQGENHLGKILMNIRDHVFA